MHDLAMTPYMVEFFFLNIDNSLYTPEQASVTLEIKADNLTTARLVADRLEKVLGSDCYKFKE